MPRPFNLCIGVLTGLLFVTSAAPAQSEQQGMTILKEAQELRDKARSKEDLRRALKKHEEALEIFQKAGANQGV